MDSKQLFYSGMVWIMAGLSLCIYGGLGLAGYNIAGVEQLVAWLSAVEGWWILIAAFLTILIEGLYFIGSFFPGSTMVILISVLSQLQSWRMFALTILTIFVGWVLSGMINIVLARWYRTSLAIPEPETFDVKDRPWTTWYPSFRANYEVAQVVSGGDPWKVFLSSTRVKVWGSLLAAVHVATLPLFIDVTKLKNEDGFVSVFVIAAIMLTVGMVQVRKSKKLATP